MSLLENVRAFMRWEGAAHPPAPAPAAKGAGDPLPLPPGQTTLTASWSQANAATFLGYFRDQSAAQAAIGKLIRDFSQARLVVYRPGRKRTLPKHPLQALLNRPNPDMSQGEILQTWLAARAVTSAGYLHLVPTRGGRFAAAGPLAEITPFPHGRVRPYSAGTRWIAGYHYQPAGTAQPEVRDRTEFVQWNWLPDPDRPGWPVGALAALLKDLDIDEELTRYVKAVLENDAVPRTGLILRKEGTLSDEAATRIQRDFARAFGADNRGKPAILQNIERIERIGLGLNELAVDSVRANGESRLCALYGVPGMLVGFTSAIDRATFSNYESAMEYYTEQTLWPTWMAAEDEINTGIVPLYEDDIEVGFDTSRVRALVENEDKRRTFILASLRGGGILIDEFRQLALQLDPLPNGEGQQRLSSNSLDGATVPKPIPPGKPAAESDPTGAPDKTDPTDETDDSDEDAEGEV